MRFDARLFHLAKDPERPGENQDASLVDSQHGIAAIADGVASAIFSGQWARLLVQAVVDSVPDPRDPEGFAAWLQRQRAEWTRAIDTRELAWFQRAKLPMGAFSTLLWVQLAEADAEQIGAYGGYRLLVHAIGDSCLFHCRGGEIVRAFPMAASTDFQADPVVLGSIDLSRDALMQFTTLDVSCFPNDTLVLCTDALAEWAMRQYEAGQPPCWDDFWDCPAEDWSRQITELRTERHIRYDDATLLLLRVKEPAAMEPLAAPQSDGGTHVAGRPPSERTDWLPSSMLSGMQRLRDKAMRAYRDTFGPKD